VGFTKSSSAFSPRAAAAYRVNDLISVRGAVYHGFRAPTLNEFYRNFSAGNTQTRANAALDPERMTGGDAGLLIGNPRTSARITMFGIASTMPSPPSRCRRRRRRSSSSGRTRIASRRTASSSRQRARDDRRHIQRGVGLTSVHYAGTTSLRGNRVPQVRPTTPRPAFSTPVRGGLVQLRCV
jgi:hypothetical protein